MSQNPTITADLCLSDIVREYPVTRVVLDRYGLKGCGGPNGPNESVAWFARLHGVPLEHLLTELNRAATDEAPAAGAFQPSIADSIYRPFFVAGLATVMTAGCTWGAINLFTIGLKKSFSGVSYSWTLAHAHAMVFGFVGLFIMGFAYQAYPRFKHKTLWRPRLALASLPLMVGGIALQTVAHLFFHNLPLILAAATLQLASLVIFALVIINTARGSKIEHYDRFVFSALAWALIAAIANPVIFRFFEMPASRDELLFNLATFNIPYRDIQLLGIAVVMILGFSLRFMPHAYGFKNPSTAWCNFLLWGLNGAILIGVVSFTVGMATSNHWLLLIQWLSAVLLLVLAVGSALQYQMFSAVPDSERDRGLKFIRAAYVWFIIAMVMLVSTPLYNFGIYMPLTGSASPFSHAFFGAYRHALTVGFIMMMIVGVSSKVVPTLSGVDVRKAPSLMPVFLLLNLGNALRVTTEIATDFFPGAYRVMGISGGIEVLGLAIWSYQLISNMRVGKQLERSSTSNLVRIQPVEISPRTIVADVLERYPQTLQTFVDHGFSPLKNPVLRKTMARVVTIEQACRREEANLDSLLLDLRKVANHTST